MDESTLREHLIPEFDLSTLDLSGATSEDEHLRAAFELAKEVLGHLYLAASASESPGCVNLPRNQMIAAGHLARLARLVRSMVRQVVDGHGGDQQLALARQVIDSAATLEYLLEDGREQVDRFDAYVLDSLIAEREFADDVRQQVKARGGERLPIEDRIERSIADTLSAANIDSLQSVPSRKRNGWPTAETRVRLLGPVVYAFYRIGSGAIHGSFTEIEKHHWRYGDDGVAIDLTSGTWRPQSLLFPSLVCVRAIVRYLQVYAPELKTALKGPISRLHTRLYQADEFHELYLQRMRSDTS